MASGREHRKHRRRYETQETIELTKPLKYRSRSMDALSTHEERRHRRKRSSSRECSPEKIQKQLHHQSRSKSQDKLLEHTPKQSRKHLSQSMSKLNYKESGHIGHNCRNNSQGRISSNNFKHNNHNISNTKNNFNKSPNKNAINKNYKTHKGRSQETPFLNHNNLNSKKRSHKSYKSVTWVDSSSGIAHLLVIATSLLTTIPMGLLSGQWQMYNSHCPLFVRATSHQQDYWGNPNMSICYLCSYLPLIVLLISLSMTIFHGSVLQAVRTKRKIPVFLKKRSYAVIMAIINSAELILAIGIAATLTDGFRQTCLSFQLSPWIQDRADSCKEGYDNRDHAYFIGNSFNRILTGVVGAWLSVIFVFQTTIIFIWRTRICSM